MATLQIPAGYGTLPLQANTHSWADMLKAQAERKKQAADLEREKAQTELDRARLPGVQGDSTVRSNQGKLSTIETGNAMIADAAAKISPSDPEAAVKWDRAMKRAAANGAPDAEQFIGKYSPALQSRVALGYSAPTAAGSLGAMSSSGMTPGAESPDLAQQVADLPPDKIEQGLKRVGDMKKALIAVQNSPDPPKAWDAAVAAFGKPELVGRYQSDFQSTWQHVADLDSAFRSVADRTGVGLPGAPPDTKIMAADGGIYAINPSGPEGPSAKALVEPRSDYSFVGTEPESGVGVYLDRRSGKETRGDTKLGAKPGGAGGRMSVFQQKQQAWLDTHPGDDAGALAYANGSKGVLTPAQAMQSAAAQASRDLNALALSGDMVTDPQGFLRQATQDHYAALMADNHPGGVASAPTDSLAPQRRQVAFDVQTIKNHLANTREGDPRRARIQNDLDKALSAASRLPAMKDPGITPPSRAVAKMREGTVTVFDNGTGWTLRKGTPVRLW